MFFFFLRTKTGKTKNKDISVLKLISKPSPKVQAIVPCFRKGERRG